MVERYQVFNGSLTQLEMHSAFPSTYTKVVKAADYEACAAELAEAKAQRDSWRRIAESGLGITAETK